MKVWVGIPDPKHCSIPYWFVGIHSWRRGQNSFQGILIGCFRKWWYPQIIHSKNFPTYPWNIPQTPNQWFMREFLSFGVQGFLGYAPRVCWGFLRSILIGISNINHPFWGFSPLFLVQHPYGYSKGSFRPIGFRLASARPFNLMTLIKSTHPWNWWGGFVSTGVRWWLVMRLLRGSGYWM